MTMTVLSAEPAHLPAITAIYQEAVLTSTATFEETPPDLAEMTARYRHLRAAGYPYLVACDDHGQVAGYAYLGPFRARSAYRFTAEDSIYIHPDHRGQGVGRRLLAALLASDYAASCHQILALIGDSDNLASIALHRALGFGQTGVMTRVGFKFGRWLDVVIMQKPAGPA